MEFSIHNSFAGQVRPVSEVSDPQQNAAKPSADPVLPEQTRYTPAPQRVIEAAKVERVADTEDARELQAITHTIRPSKNVQAFLTTATNGRVFHSIDLFV